MRVRYVLYDGDDDPPGFLVDDFVAPKRIETVKAMCDDVVKSQEHVLEQSDSDVLIGSPRVSCASRSDAKNNNQSGTIIVIIQYRFYCRRIKT